jgi:hypothetical protein
MIGIVLAALIVFSAIFSLGYLAVATVAYVSFRRAELPRHRALPEALSIGAVVWLLICIHPGGATRTVTEYA